MKENEKEIADTEAKITQLQEKLKGLKAVNKPSEEEIKDFARRVVS